MSKDKIVKGELLPEEKIRQWFLGVLFSHGVESYRVSTEYAVNISGRRLRADIVIFGRGSRQITTIVECKAFDVPLSEKVITQALVYNSVIGAQYIIATNGKKTIIYDTISKEFLSQIPQNL